MLQLFQDSFIFGEDSSSHFLRVTTSIQQLLFRSIYFFGSYVFLRSSFFKTVTSLQQLLFRNSYFFRAKLLPRSHHLKIRGSSRQLLFRKADFLVEDLFRIKIPTQELHFGSGTSVQNQLFQKSHNLERNQFFRKAIFRITNFFQRAALQSGYFLKKVLCSIAAAFSKELLFHNIIFQRSF